MVEVYNEYAQYGLEILGFPCNQFANQEPGTDEEIKKFAQGYGVTFPMFSKIDVNGDKAIPLYQWMRANSSCNNCFDISPFGQAACKAINYAKGKGYTLDDSIPWNFAKFLIDEEGNVVNYYPPHVSPQQIVPQIKQMLFN